MDDVIFPIRWKVHIKLSSNFPWGFGDKFSIKFALIEQHCFIFSAAHSADFGAFLASFLRQNQVSVSLLQETPNPEVSNSCPAAFSKQGISVP